MKIDKNEELRSLNWISQWIVFLFRARETGFATTDRDQTEYGQKKKSPENLVKNIKTTKRNETATKVFLWSKKSRFMKFVRLNFWQNYLFRSKLK